MGDLPLEIVKLVKSYDSLLAVNGVSFSIQPGEIYGLLGPNGAGKTTIISCITTLTIPTSGEVRVFGYSVQENPFQAKHLFGAVPQEMVSHGFFNVLEVLEFHSGYYGLWNNRPRIDYLLNKLGLWKFRELRVRQLSGGMKKRLLIAKALVHTPPLILLDEPTAGVDIELKEALYDFLGELKKQGTTILLTTHLLQEAELLCDRVGIISEGQIRKEGTIRQLIEELTYREIQITFKTGTNSISGKYLIKKSEKSATFQLPTGIDFSSFLQTSSISSDNIQNIQIREGTLEDVVKKTLKHQETQ